MVGLSGLVVCFLTLTLNNQRVGVESCLDLGDWLEGLGQWGRSGLGANTRWDYAMEDVLSPWRVKRSRDWMARSNRR